MQYGNFSPYARSCEYNSNEFYGNNSLGVRNGYNDRYHKRFPRNEVGNEGNYVNTDGWFDKRIGEYEGYCDTYKYRGYSSEEVLKLRHGNKSGIFIPLYGVREEEKFQLVLQSFSYVVNDWWDCNY
ncbi:hypothetical protein M9H77_30245 [Catharanthus roseus]|uniref:Uncharacterized protein n=1 Tax=Catharanthus roseus TaxID=4058 RepID=A0ACB9ZYZ8_CATRO|nr:hypothetical protein M9H77_30245 [Catharanthus roseus]